MLNKCCDIAGLGDHQSAILTDIECHPKKQNQYLQKSISGKIANLKLLHETIQQNPTKSNKIFYCNQRCKNTCQHPVKHLSTWEKLRFFVNHTQDKCGPRKISSVRYSQSWFTSRCKKKKKAKSKKSKFSIGWDKYRSAATESRKVCCHAYNEFIRNCLYENNNSSPKHLYSYIRNKQVDNVGVGPLRENGKVYIDGKNKARISNSQFESAFSIDKGDIPLIQTQFAKSSIQIFTQRA